MIVLTPVWKRARPICPLHSESGPIVARHRNDATGPEAAIRHAVKDGAAETRPGIGCPTIVSVQIAMGLLIDFVEGWSLSDAVYFTFVTGLTVGYGE